VDVAGKRGRGSAKKLAGVLVALLLGAVLLAILFVGGRLFWESFRGAETAPPAQATVAQPSASAGPSASTPETPAQAQPSAADAATGNKLAADAATASVRLAWDRAMDARVTGYKILFGTQPGDYPEAMSVGNQTSATLTGLRRATRYYIVTVAVDAQGNQSPPSNEVEALTPP
jgi:hypothetical protein